MKHVNGIDMFDYAAAEKHFIVVTTNNVINSDGQLVMGAGAAKRAVEIFGGNLAERCAVAVRKKLRTSRINWKVIDKEGKRLECSDAREDSYGFLKIGQKFGIFQTKSHFLHNAKMEHIKYSARTLGAMAKNNPDITFHLNFPGIGLGGLRGEKEKITKILQEYLPDNVWVHEF